MTSPLAGTLGIDFGTSNSAMAWLNGQGVARLLPLEGTAVSMPTAVFYNAEDRSTHFGRAAVAQYLSGTEGRLMRSLKSLLGSPWLQETTLVNHQPLRFQDIVTTFLAALRERAAAATGQLPAQVVMGRPVHFVDDHPQRDAQAQQSLQDAAHAAGFEQVSFQLEPVAAALDYERRLTHEALVLVVDIGGGTSDFTVVRLGPDRSLRRDRSQDVLATAGVHLGGTDFDHKLSLENVMPLLGFRHLGPQGREVPSRVFFDLSTWHLIQWLYAPRAIGSAQGLRVNYTDVALHARLMDVLRQRLGHHVAHEVEQAKILCSQSGGNTSVDLACIEPGLAAPLPASVMAAQLQSQLEQVVACARECVRKAGVPLHGLDAVYLTGGSSALRPLQQALAAAFAGVPMVEGDLFGGVATGLSYSQT